MAVITSSLLGANLNSSDSTALFTLGTVATTTDGGIYEYVCVTSTLVTGELVTINPTGTAQALLTAYLTAPTIGIMIAAAQNLINRDQFGWVARAGHNLYILCTGTVTANSGDGYAFSANSGRLENAPACGVGQTALGIFLTTSASTATASCAIGTLQWPRSIITIHS